MMCNSENKLNTEVYYVWMIPTQLEENDTPRLLFPQSDPNVYEYPFDFLFNTQESAYKALDDFEVREEAIKDKWVLVKETLEPINFVSDTDTLSIQYPQIGDTCSGIGCGGVLGATEDGVTCPECGLVWNYNDDR